MYRFGLIKPRPVIRAIPWATLRGHAGVRSIVPPSPDYLTGLPADVGMDGNDSVGDCFWAAVCHLSDLHRYLVNGGAYAASPASVALGAYAAATGYDPSQQQPDGSNPTDQGTDPQQGFGWLAAHGLAGDAEKFPPIEIDPTNLADVLQAIQDCGGVMTGITVPSSITYDPSQIWDFPPGATLTDDGHEIFVAKGSPSGNFGLVSWGSPRYEMTQAFWKNCVNQCTAYVDADWFRATGKTILGMTVDQLQAIVDAWRGGDIL